jgi:hypothetical protein
VTNIFLNETVYANTMLLLLKNTLVMGRLVNSKYENKVTDENGLTVSVKRPPRFARNDASQQSAALAAQDILTGSINVAVNQYAKVHISVGDIEYIKSYNELMRNETMKSAASTLAHQIDDFLAKKTRGFHSYVGHATTPTNNIGSPAEFNPVHTRLMNQGVPNSDLNAAVLFDDAEEIRGSLISGNIDDINRSALERSRVPLLSEINVYGTQQCPSITTGTRAGTTLIDLGTLSVNYRDVKDTVGALSPLTMTIHVDGFTGATDTVKAGEILTIGSVFAWDWRNNVQLPYLQQFVVQQDATCAGNETDLVISPPIIVQGTSDGVDTNGNTAFATTNAAAVDGAAVTFLGAASTTYRVRTAFHKSAISMVSARLVTPFTGTASFAQDPDTGISIRYWRGSDISTGAHVHRWDCMYGASLTDGYLGSRVSGT